jgi:ATP-binding cassette subfamily B protein
MKIFYSFINIINDLRKIIAEYPNKNKIYILLFLTLITSFFELATISSILPLLDFILNVQNVKNFKFFLIIADLFQIQTENFRYFIFFIFGFFLLFSYVFKIILIWISAFITHDLYFYIHNNIFKKTLAQDYTYFKDSNSSFFIGNLEKVDMCRGAIFNLLQLITSLILSISIILLILFVDFYTVFFFVVICFFFYGIIFICIKKKLSNISFLGSKLINTRYKILLECTENIKEIILRNLNNFFINKQKKIIEDIKNIRIQSELYSNIPGQLIICFITLVILSLIFFYSFYTKSLIERLPILGLLILAAQRILPNLQNIFVSLNGLKINQKSISDIIEIYNLTSNHIAISSKNNVEILILKEKFSVKDISFSYKNQKSLFDNSELEFSLGKIYLLKGASGSGKSSLFDIIMGLIESKKTTFYIDDKKFNPYLNRSWQELICYVPQNTILNDSTILENIIYGRHEYEIDQELIRQVCADAEILDFVNNTENGFRTVIGERGIRLSGGQRQRLSIAKALYNSKPIILLDEATNALDFDTEKKIYKNLKLISSEKIIISIAHSDKFDDLFDHVYLINNRLIKKIK